MPAAMPAATKDPTRLRVDRMESARLLRRRRAADLRASRAEEERRLRSTGEVGDVDFVGLVRGWREEREGSARPMGDPSWDGPSHPAGGGGGDKIRVVIRKRPLNSKELARSEHDAVSVHHPVATVHVPRTKVDGITKYCDHLDFRFDRAFDENSGTEEVYRHACGPLVGYVCGVGGGGGDGGRGGRSGGGVPRATVFAYGQTGSGKTHTMGGIQEMVAEDLFRALSDDDDAGLPSEDVSVGLAMFEIYGGRIQDLLHGRKRLKVLEDGSGEVVVSGLGELSVSGSRELLALLDRGARNRTTHATEANDASSRSHSVAQLLLRDRTTGRLRGKLSLVDLAGSERGNDTRSHDRQRRTESSDINTSLLALKECIRAVDSDSRHVPYRQSKLTLILKDCFTAKTARTSMIATLSPRSGSADHTANTLRYADRIKEKKVGDVLSPSNRSRGRTAATGGGMAKASPARPARPVDDVLAVPDENDEYDEDSFESAKEPDELEELLGDEDEDEDGAAVASTADAKASDEPDDDGDDDLRGLTEVDRTVRALLVEEEALLEMHMRSIQENAELLTEEGELLKDVQEEDGDVDAYAARLGEILDRKTEMIGDVRERLGSYRELLRKEEELAGMG